ncbi:MAG: hypothetical protein HFJ41_05510 [Clostridia bacterium]|nr:hypothetical protein [Clostridia bacterium]
MSTFLSLIYTPIIIILALTCEMSVSIPLSIIAGAIIIAQAIDKKNK